MRNVQFICELHLFTVSCACICVSINLSTHSAVLNMASFSEASDLLAKEFGSVFFTADEGIDITARYKDNKAEQIKVKNRQDYVKEIGVCVHET